MRNNQTNFNWAKHLDIIAFNSEMNTVLLRFDIHYLFRFTDIPYRETFETFYRFSIQDSICSFIEIALRHGCSPANFTRTPMEGCQLIWSANGCLWRFTSFCVLWEVPRNVKKILTTQLNELSMWSFYIQILLGYWKTFMAKHFMRKK